MYSLLALGPIPKNIFRLYLDIILNGVHPVLTYIMAISTIWGIILAVRDTFDGINLSSFLTIVTGVGGTLVINAHLGEKLPLQESVWAGIVGIASVYIVIALIIFLHRIGFFSAVLSILRFIGRFIRGATIGAAAGAFIGAILVHFLQYETEVSVVAGWGAMAIGGLDSLFGYTD